MGGRLGRKRRGYNVTEAKGTGTENPEVKQNDPENQVASKEQFKESGEQQPETEAPKKADESSGEKQMALVTVDVESAGRNADVAIESASIELPRGSKMQENVISASLVEEKQLPDEAEHRPLTEADVQSNAVPKTDLAAEVPDVPSESEPQSKEIPDCDSIGEKLPSGLDKGASVTEISKDPSTEKSSLGDQAVPNLDTQLAINSCGNLDDRAGSGEVLQGVSGETSDAAISLPVSHKVPLQPAPKEMETSIQEMQSESPAKCDSSKEVEALKLVAIIEETPIDVVLKNEVAMCAGLEKDVTEPSTQDEVRGEVAGEPLHSTTQVTPDSGEQADCVQDNSAHGNSNVAVLEDLSQSSKGSGNASVDVSQMDSCSVTDVVQEDPVAAESAPENPRPSAEKVTETSQRLFSCQDSIEISLLKTSSELIPDIKLTVYGEDLQEEEMKSDPQLASVDETIESNVLNTNADPQSPNEVVDENLSTSHSVEVALETPESLDQEMVKLETSGDPAPESGSSAHIEEVATKVNTEETSSTENPTGFVDGGELNEFVTSKTEDDHPETSAANGSTLGGELRKGSKTEVIGQSITAEVENLQANGLAPIANKTTEQVIEDLPPKEPCLVLDNQTLNSGPVDVNIE